SQQSAVPPPRGTGVFAMSDDPIQPSGRRTEITRRHFLGAAAAAAAGLATTPRDALARSGTSAFLFGADPDSNFGGVQIGAITYSFRSLPSSAEQLLGYLVDCGISSTELMG